MLQDCDPTKARVSFLGRCKAIHHFHEGTKHPQTFPNTRSCVLKMRVPCVGSGAVGPFRPPLQRAEDKTLTRLEWKCLTCCHKNKPELPSQFLSLNSLHLLALLLVQQLVAELADTTLGKNTPEHGILLCQAWSHSPCPSVTPELVCTMW